MGFVGIVFELGNCVSTFFDEDGFLVAQPDGMGDEPQVEPIQLHHPYGFIARPLDPVVDETGKIIEGSACTLLFGTWGTETHAWLCGDPRSTPSLPAIEPGESVQYGAAGNFVRCKNDGTVTLFTTTTGDYDGPSVYAQVRPDGFRCVTPWGKMDLGPNGFHVNHSSGARIDLGSIGGLPAPLDAYGSYVKIAGAIAQIESAAVALGAPTGVADPAAKATPTVAALASIATALTAVQGALTALGSIGANASAGVAIAASATAVGATTSALASAATTIPSTNTTVT